ncbi:MAG: DNA gyrase subunit B, partial [Desulfohalobiaceae bacterium]|nr:DNA gyrase subunit B [Desulfohalobiaceae bacterium]
YTGQELVDFLQKIISLQERLKEAVNIGLNEDLFLNLVEFGEKLTPQDFEASATETSHEVKSERFEEIKGFLEQKGYSLHLERQEMEEVVRTFLRFVDRNEKKITLGVEFFNSKLYRHTFDLLDDLKRGHPEFDFQLHLKNGQSVRFDSPFELLEYILAEGDKRFSVQRYKGLGEMNPEQLWKTTMHQENRNLVQVKVEEAEEADTIFRQLMGEQVEPRRAFIEKNALAVEDLDI